MNTYKKRQLQKAGILNHKLQGSYLACKALAAEHGKTYYLATRLLPAEKRPFIHSLYAFARYADDIVDSTHTTVDEKRKALDVYCNNFLTECPKGYSKHHVLHATIDTIHRWNIPLSYFESFISSMKMDLTTTEYETYDDLYEYMYGSAAVIALQVLPILEPSSERAKQPAIDLGIAFQLANFIRDVGEDLDRGRIYLPLDELEQFGVTRKMLQHRITTQEIRNALRFQIQRVKDLEKQSRAGIPLLKKEARPCIHAARILYCKIADQVKKDDYQIFTKRSVVPRRTRIHIAGKYWMSSLMT